MADKSQELDSGHSKKMPSVLVPEAREKRLQRIFGTSLVFFNVDEIKPRSPGSTVPHKVKEYYQQGHKSLEDEEWETAVLHFSRALHLDSKLIDFYIFRAEAFIQLCDFSSALQNLRRAYFCQPKNPKYLDRLAFILYLQGQCLYELCDFQEALSIFLQASDLQPQSPSFNYRCMACLLALKRYQDCLSLITREMQQGRASADVYILRARIYNFFQKAKLCYQDLRSALVLEPNHPQAKGLLQMMVDQAKQALQDASILAMQGKLHRALKRITCAIENNPLDPNLFLFRGILYRRLQQFDPAVEDFLKALDMVKDTQEDLMQQTQRQLLLTYNDFAVHCYNHGAYQEGVLLLNKAIRDEQNEKGLYINRGDCFFQLGNLAFAEADYKQALVLSPQDEGANLRMGVLQEKMGFCEQTRRQFQTAEDHFSRAIKHNPQKPQYYLHRAKSRQLLQNLLGAREDVATVLLLNPKYPKMGILMNNLFPGMTVEDVLKSQVAQLAKLQLKQMIENGPRTHHPQSIVEQRLMERQKARALLESWRQELFFTDIPEEELATSQTLQEKTVEDTTEFKKAGAEEKKEKISHRVTTLSDSYVDQTSSGSVYSIMSITTSGMDISTSQEYKSSSTTSVMPSDSSLPKSQSSEPKKNREHRVQSWAPRVSQASDSTKQNLTEASRSQRHSSSKAEATEDSKPKPWDTEIAQGPGQTSSPTEDTAAPVPKSSKGRAALSPRQRLRRAKIVHAHNWKFKVQDISQTKLRKTSSKSYLSPTKVGSFSSISECLYQTPGISKDADSSSCSHTSSNKTDTSGTEPTPQQTQEYPESETEALTTPHHNAVP